MGIGELEAKSHVGLAAKALELVCISKCFIFEPRKKDAKNYS